MESETVEKSFERIGFGKFHYILVLICGIIQSFDAIELLLLAYIQPLLKCVWRTTLWEDSFLVTAVFIGMMIGAPVLGRLCDMYGRKHILVISSCTLAYLGLLCAASPTIVWVTIIRTVIGACLGGIMSSLSTLASELMPLRNRGRALISIFAFWPIGFYVITIMCITIVPAFGWRIFIVISTLPIVLTLPCLLWLPESPRFLLLNHRKKEAIAIINRIAIFNNCAHIVDVIEPIDVAGHHSMWDLLHRDYWPTTVITSFLWLVSGLTYYGIVLIVTVIDSTPRQCLQNLNTYHNRTFSATSDDDDSCCLRITWGNSVNTFISTTGELVFIPLTLLMVNVIGRKYSVALLSIVTALLFVIINFCMPSLLLVTLLLLLRGSISACFNVIFIYTSEVFPTSVRSFATGICSIASRIGAMMSPLIINFVITKHSFLKGTIIFTFFNMAAFVAALMLPYETKGRPLFQTADEFVMTPTNEVSK